MENLYNKASLVLTPQMVEAGKVYSMKPEDRKGDFTFSRSTAATRVNASGNIEKETQNLLLYSGDLTQSQWQNVRTTDVSGQTGYDGTNNAFKIIPTTDNNTHRLDYVDTWPTGQVYTFSFYARADGYNTIDIFIGGTSIGSDYGRFNLSTGTASNVGVSISTSMEDVGSGWYRCQVAQISGATTRINIGINDGTTQSYVGDGTSGVLIQHPQLEQGLVARDYIETTTTAIYGGITDNVPRLDYTDSSCPALLLEPQRTNLIPHSEYIQGLSLTDLTATPNATTSPEGVQNAYKMLTGTAGNEQISHQVTGTSGNNKTHSVYIKADSGVQWIRLIQIRSGFSNSASIWFDIQNGVKGSKTGDGTTSVVDDATKIEDAGNGWYRLTLVCTDSTNNTNFDTRVRTAIADGSLTRVSNGSYFVWGYQMESDASYPTSYIPTYGVSQTRLRDIQSELTIPNGSATEGTIFYEFNKAQAPNSFDITPLQIGSVKVLSIQQYNPNMRFDINNNAANYNEPNSYNSHIKVAASYVGSVVKLFINGNLRATDNTYSGSGSVVVPENGLQKTQIGCSIESKQLLYFPTALTDQEAIDLTTI